MSQRDIVFAKRDEVNAVGRANKARRLYLFGSCARGEDTPESDIDFIADFDESASIFDVVGLEHELSRLFNKPVDVVCYERLYAYDNGRFRTSAEKDMVLV